MGGQDCSVLVLAGGLGSRLGTISELMPKAMFPVSCSQTLLSRTIFTLASLDFTQFTVSTSSKFYPFFRTALKLIEECCIDRIECTVIQTSAHELGPVPALARALASLPPRRCLLCLPDIYFEKLDPQMFRQHSHERNLLFGTTVVPGRDGYLYQNETGLVLECNKYGPGHVRGLEWNWSGMAMMQPEAIKILVAWGIDQGAVPLETAFSHIISSGIDVHAVDCGPFDNVNAFRDIVRLQALNLERYGDER